MLPGLVPLKIMLEGKLRKMFRAQCHLKSTEPTKSKMAFKSERGTMEMAPNALPLQIINFHGNITSCIRSFASCDSQGKPDLCSPSISP